MAILTPTVVKTDCPHVAVYLRWDGTEPGGAAAMRIKACSKENWTCEFIRQLPAGTVLYDIGANVGSYAIMAAKLGHPVVAIEPGYANYHHLVRNAILNGVEESCLCLPLALSDRAGLDWLHYGELGAAAASHMMGQPVPGNVPVQFHRQPVMVWPLDMLIELLGLPAPQFIKLDVDGHESRVLVGAAKTLSTVQAVMLEMKADQEAPLVTRMKEYGLELQARFDERNGQKIAGVVYGFFQRPQVSAAIGQPTENGSACAASEPVAVG